MVAALNERTGPLGLVVTGEAQDWQDALEKMIGPQWIRTYQVKNQGQLLEVISSGLADAAILDDAASLGLDTLKLLRIIRRVNTIVPVVMVTAHTERRWLEDALSLAAFSVVIRPLELEELLRQIQRMMARLDQMLR